MRFDHALIIRAIAGCGGLGLRRRLWVNLASAAPACRFGLVAVPSVAAVAQGLASAPPQPDRALPAPSARVRGAGRGARASLRLPLEQSPSRTCYAAAFIARKRLLRRGCGAGPSGRKAVGGSTPPRLHQLTCEPSPLFTWSRPSALACLPRRASWKRSSASCRCRAPKREAEKNARTIG